MSPTPLNSSQFSDYVHRWHLHNFLWKISTTRPSLNPVRFLGPLKSSPHFTLPFSRTEIHIQLTPVLASTGVHQIYGVDNPHMRPCMRGHLYRHTSHFPQSFQIFHYFQLQRFSPLQPCIRAPQMGLPSVLTPGCRYPGYPLLALWSDNLPPHPLPSLRPLHQPCILKTLRASSALDFTFLGARFEYPVDNSTKSATFQHKFQLYLYTKTSFIAILEEDSHYMDRVCNR